MDTAGSAVPSDSALKGGSVSLAGLTAEAIGSNGPETNAAATTAFIFIFSAAATPFLFLLALIPGICYAKTLGRFARKFVSAGGVYQFVKGALGDRTGLAGGWIYFMGIFLFVPGAAVLGAYLLDLLGVALFGEGSWFGHGHWFEIAIVILLVCGWLAWRGVSLSVELLLALSTFGITSILVLDFVMLFSGNDTGFSLSALLPWNSGVSFQNLAGGETTHR